MARQFKSKGGQIPHRNEESWLLLPDLGVDRSGADHSRLHLHLNINDI